jgi:hypothetical protein
MSLQNIPAELRRLHQWVVAHDDKIPINPRTGGLADPVDPATWASFDEACRTGIKHVGFVLSRSDPYCFIDLDAPINGVQEERHQNILSAVESYAEMSQSGSGVHIICKGVIPHGVRRDKVEVYSAERYMICTGKTINCLPITDQQPLLDILFQEMSSTGKVALVEELELMSDEDVWSMGSKAVNGDKFEQLWSGDFQGYPSQSEADFALMAMLCYYSKSNEQCRRLFQMSELGKRDKAQRPKYLNYMIAKCRANEPAPVNLPEIRLRTEKLLPTPPPKAHEIGTAITAGTSIAVRSRADLDPEPKPSAIKYPQGLIGELADYFYSSAIRPVAEVALISAMALAAGIVGRSYNISNTGLNQYLILLAKTGSGKEGIASGIDAVVAAVRPTIPLADRFLGPAAFASGQALVRVLDERPCFVSILGEFGVTLQSLCDPRAPAPTAMLKRVLLDLYNKSGFNKVLRGSVYSDTEKNTRMIQAPNVTLLGESTPDEFYGGLDASHILSGLVPRFSVVEYTGPRPHRNRNAFHTPPDTLITGLGELITIGLTTQQNTTCCPVQCDAFALGIFDELDDLATQQINSRGEVERHLWNRTHLKALKLGALLAVGRDPQNPIISREDAEWARDFVIRDVTLLTTKFALANRLSPSVTFAGV